jgi:S1-C subfamily serine protease
MFRSRLTRGLALGTGALASGALLLAIAPSATATETADDSAPARHGAVIDRPYFGARIALTANGATVVHVVDGSPADTAGLSEGDLVVSIDDVTLDERGALREALQDAEAGDVLSIVYTHDGDQKTASVTVGDAADRPEPPAREDVPWVGAQLVRFETADGVLVRHVAEDGPAADAGITEGDIVTAIDGQEITDWWQAREILRDLAPGDAVKLTVTTDSGSKTVTVTLGSAADAPERPAKGDRPGGPGGNGARDGGPDGKPSALSAA